MANAFSKLAFLRWGIRGFDILVLLAYPTLGAVFALPELTFAAAARLIVFSGLNVLFLTHIYLINDWSDARLNPEEPHQRKVQALKRPELISERQILVLAALLLAAASAGFFFLSRELFLLGLIIAALTLLYSHPRANCKGVPVLSTFIHLAFAVLYFLGGWVLFRPVSLPAAAIGLFFGLVLSAGHFSNEIQDFSSDLQARIRTNAISFGQRLVFRVGLTLFLLSSIYFLALIREGCLPRSFTPIGWIIILLWIIQTIRYRGWKGGDSILAFRSFYRWVYALAAFAMLVLLWWEKR